MPCALGIIIGTLFLQEETDQAAAIQRAGLIYFSMLISNLIAIRKILLHLSMPFFLLLVTYFIQTELKAKIIQERPVLYRERAALTYTSVVYALNIVLVEIPFILLNTVTYVYAPFFIFVACFFSYFTKATTGFQYSSVLHLRPSI